MNGVSFRGYQLAKGTFLAIQGGSPVGAVLVIETLIPEMKLEYWVVTHAHKTPGVDGGGPLEIRATGLDHADLGEFQSWCGTEFSGQELEQFQHSVSYQGPVA